MKTRPIMWTTALLVVCVVAASAADVTGKWVAQVVPGRGGQTQEITFAFKMEDGKLTGTVTSPRGEQAISEGTVSGDTISFVVVRQGGRGEVKELFKGTVSGNEIKFTRTRAGGGGRGGPAEFVAKKAS